MTADSLRREQEKQRAEDQDVARVAVRLCSRLMLRVTAHLSAMTGGDTLLGIVFIAISEANTAHIDARPDPRGAHRSIEDVVPDEKRRPISKRAVAAALGLPTETARRYIVKLEAMGACKAVRGGVIVPAEYLRSPNAVHHTVSTVADIRLFVRALKASGLDFD